MKTFLKKSLSLSLIVALGILLYLTISISPLIFKERPILPLEVFVISFVLTIANYGFFKVLNRKVSWEADPWRAALYGFFGSLILTVVLFVGLIYIDLVLIHRDLSSQQFWSPGLISGLAFPLKIAVAVDVVMHAIFFYKSWKDAEIKEQELRANRETAKFDTLKNQLDPHFLFNSLNTLSSLIEEDPKRALEFNKGLSKIYRYVLEQRENVTVPVTEELRFAQAYLRLLKMRFEDTFFCETPDLSMFEVERIVPLSLQMVLENALKHNSFSEKKLLQIRINKEGNYLTIRNTLQPKTLLHGSPGTGLENIKKRYALLTNIPVIIEETDTEFGVKLPMLKK